MLKNKLSILVGTFLLIVFSSVLALSQTNTQSKREYQIDNVNKLVAVPFDTIYVWGNYFIRYEYLEKDNKKQDFPKKCFDGDTTRNL